MFYQWAPYVPVAERRRKAAAEMAKLATKGHAIAPVRIEGRAIATTAWGKAWCANMERYSDYGNRLPRGRTYVRNGSVVHLQIEPGKVTARVSGSSIYHTTITVKRLAPAAWTALCTDCAGGIDSLVELLQGRFAAGVMERLCRQGDGLFPPPKDIRFDCSCPDSATMCKHVAAVLYGIGARFDHQPELLFALRQVDASALLARAGDGLTAQGTSQRALESTDIGGLFGLEMEAAQEGGSSSVKDRQTARTSVREAGHAAGRPLRGAARATTPAQATSAKRSKHPGSTRPDRRSAAAQRQPPAETGKGVPRDPTAILLAALRDNGVLDNASGRAATGLDGTAVRQLLQQLVRSGQARITGRKRGTRYLPAFR